MLWLERPPYWRWALVGLLAVVSLWLELRPDDSVDHPFLARDVAVGEPVEGALVWRSLPEGALETATAAGFAARPLTAGQPLVRGDVVPDPVAAPPGWWIVEVEVPSEAAAGGRVQLVVLPEPGRRPLQPIEGVAVEVRPAGYEGGNPVASVAVPPDRAATAAAAIAEQRVSVLVQPP